jgi:iron-sulfur cluster assembly protein
MFKLSAEAASQIRQAAQQNGAQDMALRIAAKRERDGSIQYGMGFDAEREQDVQLVMEGVTVLISHQSKDLLNGAMLDFVELNPGEFQFIFINPNDNGEAASGGGCGSGGCGSGGCGSGDTGSGGCH